VGEVVVELGGSLLEWIEVDISNERKHCGHEIEHKPDVAMMFVNLMWLFLVLHVIDRYTCLFFRSAMTGSHYHAENNQA
jgi:hypothetical protein